MSSIFAGTCFSFLHHLQVPVRSSGRFKLVQKGPEIICAAPRRRCTQGGLPMKLLVIYPPCRVTIRSGEQVDGSWCKFKGKMAEGGEDRRGTFWAFLHDLQVPGRSSGRCAEKRHAAPPPFRILPLYIPPSTVGAASSTVGAASSTKIARATAVFVRNSGTEHATRQASGDAHHQISCHPAIPCQPPATRRPAACSRLLHTTASLLRCELSERMSRPLHAGIKVQ